MSFLLTWQFLIPAAVLYWYSSRQLFFIAWVLITKEVYKSSDSFLPPRVMVWIPLFGEIALVAASSLVLFFVFIESKSWDKIIYNNYIKPENQ